MGKASPALLWGSPGLHLGPEQALGTHCAVQAAQSTPSPGVGPHPRPSQLQRASSTCLLTPAQHRNLYCPPALIAGGDVHWDNHMEISLPIPQKIKNRVSIRPNNPSPGNIPEKLEIRYSQRYMHLYVPCSMIRGGRDRETTEMSCERGLDEDVVHGATIARR